MWNAEKKVELLAPAGSMEALRAAVQNGCDAVYLGGSMFGARAFANNFDEEELIEAIAYAHVYGVRVFVTVNTLIREEEFDDCVAYVQFLYAHDVDAVIIQDLGLFSVLHERFPDMELHASTQMHIHNPQGIRFMEACGASRKGTGTSEKTADTEYRPRIENPCKQHTGISGNHSKQSYPAP